MTIPLLGFCAYSGTGKTTLLTAVLPILKQAELRVAVIKHAHHDFDMDDPKKDSYKIRKSGAEQMMVISRKRAAIIHEFGTDSDEPTLADALHILDASQMDLILVEGFKKECFPKIELYRPSLGFPLVCSHDSNIIAVASDAAIEHAPTHLPKLDLNNIDAMAAFIQTYAQTEHPSLHSVQR